MSTDQGSQPSYMKPVSMGRRLGMAAFGIGFIALGAFMFMHYDLFVGVNTDEANRARTRWIFKILSWIWSRPAGVIIGLVGLLVLWSAKEKFEDTRSLEEIARSRAAGEK